MLHPTDPRMPFVQGNPAEPGIWVSALLWGSQGTTNTYECQMTPYFPSPMAMEYWGQGGAQPAMQDDWGGGNPKGRTCLPRISLHLSLLKIMRIMKFRRGMNGHLVFQLKISPIRFIWVTKLFL